MDSAGKDSSTPMVINASRHDVFSVLFAENGKQVLSGGVDGVLQCWQVDGRHKVGEPVRTGGAQIRAAALSPDRKWFVCGLQPSKSENPNYVGVWDARTHEKVFDAKGHHTNSVISVDVSSDSSRFATGSADNQAFIWSIKTGAKLIGPLRHSGVVVAVRFSPHAERLATATAENPPGVARSIRIYSTTNGQLLRVIPEFRVGNYISSPLAWSLDGHQLFAASYSETDSEVKHFDTASGSLLCKWSVPGGGYTTSIALSRNQEFIAVVAYKSLSFWDTSTHQQIGATVELTSTVWSLALSPDDSYIATAERNGKVTLHVPPVSNVTVHVSTFHDNVGRADLSWFAFLPGIKLPFIHISDAMTKLWAQGDLIHVEGLFTEEIVRALASSHHAQALAHRALVRCRLKRWDMAIDDAEKSIELQRSVAGYIACAMAHVGDGDHDSAMRVFDLVFSDNFPTENNFLLLIKAIILFLCGKREDGRLRVDALINIVDDKSLYLTVRAQMLLLLAGASMREGDNKRTMELLSRAREAIPIRKSPHLVLISLISGWDFDRLEPSIRLHLQECIKPFEGLGDAAVQSKDLEEAILRYSLALSLNPPNPAGLLIKRSKAQGTLGLWQDALRDADEAIKADPANVLGYESRRTALHTLQRYDEAVDTLSRMLSLIDESPDPHARQLGKNYVPPSRSDAVITSVVRMVNKSYPLVLIDVKSGRLCNEQDRIHIFKSETQFKALVSSMPQVLDNKRIQRVVEEYFRYVTLSHVWDGQQEPSFQAVESKSVKRLGPSPQNDKLRKFCEVVDNDGYRWAWSDTCCIDKTDGVVLSKSLIKMYEWYEESAATFAHLATVDSSSSIGNIKDSIWMTRAWTAQELLAPKVIRFYDRNWKPYLGDTRSNHKESPAIMQELVNAVGMARETIISFNPGDLTVREKLRLASTRNATVEEDVAYSLIGIFQSDIVPRYGEGDTALGHLLGEIVARLGEVTVLAWTGKSSSYNSCLPATLAVYRQTPHTSPAIEGAEMDQRVAALRSSVPTTEAVQIHALVTGLPQAVFTHRRLRLPCIIFPVGKLTVRDFGRDHENNYHARVSGIGTVEFQTSDRLPLAEPRRLILVHPWIRDLCGPVDGFIWGNIADNTEYQYHPETKAEADSSSPLLLSVPPSAVARVDDYTRALRLIVRLQQPFPALLLQQQRDGVFKRVAAEHEIVVSGIASEPLINLARDIRVMIVDIL